MILFLGVVYLVKTLLWIFLFEMHQVSRSWSKFQIVVKVSKEAFCKEFAKRNSFTLNSTLCSDLDSA